MKVDSISNFTYTPGVAQERQAGNARPLSQEQKTKVSAEKVPSKSGLTGDEREFFAKLFPDSVAQIALHKTYSPTGVSAPAEKGQIINRKV